MVVALQAVRFAPRFAFLYLCKALREVGSFDEFSSTQSLQQLLRPTLVRRAIPARRT